MKVLVVGGTGLIGAEIALYLQAAAVDVSIMGRNRSAVPALASLPFIQGDYLTAPSSLLEGFDSLVFAAGADLRYLPLDGSETPESFYTRVNTEGIPAFFERAQKAGVGRCVYIGTFYPQVAPQRIGVCPYVTSRHLADEAIRAMSCNGFNVCSLNAPFVLGHVDGLPVPHLEVLAQYARGQLPDLPLFAPRGGTNHISARSIAEATAAALERGDSAVPYLLGDENYSWKDYLELWFSAVGNPQTLEVRSDDHPLLPNAIMFAGAGATINYQPDPAELALLGYSRGQIRPLIEAMAKSL